MNRALALIVAIALGFAAAFLVTAFSMATLYGVLWIFVFGDDPWPTWVRSGLDIAVYAVGFLLWAIFGWLIWKRLTAPRGEG